MFFLSALLTGKIDDKAHTCTYIKLLGDTEITKLKTTSYKFPYPVADTESGPTLYWDRFVLEVNFVSYQNISCKAIFDDVSHFEFISEDEVTHGNYSYDGVVEVKNSPLIEKLVSVGEIDKSEALELKHIVIGFNEIGSYLTIVFKNDRYEHNTNIT